MADERVSLLDRMGRGKLHYAALEGRLGDVLLQIEAGADVSLADLEGHTPLHFAAQEQHVEIARVLLDAGASVEARDDRGNTPLWKATYSCAGVHGELISLLRARGADPYRANDYGVSPLDLSLRTANYNIRQFYADLLPEDSQAEQEPGADDAQGGEAMQKDLTAQIAQLDAAASFALEYAARLTVEAGHHMVSISHFLVACVETDKPSRDLLREAGVDPLRVGERGKQWLERLSAGNTRLPVFAPCLLRLIEEATGVREEPVSPTQLLSTLLTLLDLRALAVEAVPELAGVELSE